MASGMIPHVFHTLWVQGPPLPADHQSWFDSWTACNPGWGHRLWSEADYAPLLGPLENIYVTAVNHAQRAELARLAILHAEGGVVLDADFECLRPWDFLESVDCFAPFESPGQLTMSLLGAVPAHPAVYQLMLNAEPSIRMQRARGLPQTFGTGPQLIQRCWATRQDVTRFPADMFFPYLWDEPDPGSYGDAYAAHHWTASWKDTDGLAGQTTADVAGTFR